MAVQPGTTFLRVMSVVLVSSGVGVGLGRLASTQLRAQIARKGLQAEKTYAFITGTKNVTTTPERDYKIFTVTIDIGDQSWRKSPATLFRYSFSKNDVIETNGVILPSESSTGTLLEIMSLEELAVRYPQLVDKRDNLEFLRRRLYPVRRKQGEEPKCVKPDYCRGCVKKEDADGKVYCECTD
jgi:hypothetical protein